MVVPPGVPDLWSVTVTPALVVEVHSITTRRFNIHLKSLVFGELGVPSYWMVEPDDPSVTVLELGDDGYRTVAEATGDTPLRVERPFPVELVPSALLLP